MLLTRWSGLRWNGPILELESEKGNYGHIPTSVCIFMATRSTKSQRVFSILRPFQAFYL